jgi:uncharacterized protein involved in cysteine biosynthesis
VEVGAIHSILILVALVLGPVAVAVAMVEWAERRYQRRQPPPGDD